MSELISNQTSLILAISKNDLDLAQKTIEKDINVNFNYYFPVSNSPLPSTVGPFTGTPLILAILLGNLDMCKLLIESGADVNATGSTRVKKYIPLNQAFGKFEIFKLLIESHANVNVIDEFGETPLIHAMRQFHFDYAKLLIESGANIHYEYQSLSMFTRSIYGNDYTETIFDVAIRNSSLDICELLINSGININESGKTYLLDSIIYSKGCTKKFELFISKIDFNFKDNKNIFKMVKQTIKKEKLDNKFYLILKKYKKHNKFSFSSLLSFF